MQGTPRKMLKHVSADSPAASCRGVRGRARSFTEMRLAAAAKLGSLSTRSSAWEKRSVNRSAWLTRTAKPCKVHRRAAAVDLMVSDMHADVYSTQRSCATGAEGCVDGLM